MREEAERSRRSFKEVVNQAIRAGLRDAAGEPSRTPFRTRGHSFGLRPGIDPDKLNQLVDELEVDAMRETLGRHERMTRGTERERGVV